MDEITVKYMEKALNEVNDAWHNAGSHPTYHKRMQETLRRDWPTLARAIENLNSLKL